MQNPIKKFNLITVASVGVLVLVIIAIILLALNNHRQSIKQKIDNQNATTTDTAVKTESTRGAPPIDNTDHILGDINAPIQFIVYSDFECPSCLLYADTVKKVKDYFGDKVVIAYRHFPLRMHDNALPAAIASECAADQGKFWQMHDQIFADNKLDTMSDEKYTENAKTIGLDVVKFAKCFQFKEHQDEIILEMGNGRNVGVNGTPTTFINGDVLQGAYQFEDFTDSRGDKREGLKSIINKKFVD